METSPSSEASGVDVELLISRNAARSPHTKHDVSHSSQLCISWKLLSEASSAPAACATCARKEGFACCLRRTVPATDFRENMVILVCLFTQLWQCSFLRAPFQPSGVGYRCEPCKNRIAEEEGETIGSNALGYILWF